MSEEKVSFFDEFKKQIIAGVGIVITAVSGIVITQFKEIVGIVDEESAQTEQVIQQPTQPQNITINLPEQKKDTVTLFFFLLQSQEWFHLTS